MTDPDRTAEADADAQRDEFACTLAHEMRAALQPVLHAAEVLRLSESDPQAGRRALQVVVNGVRRLSDTFEGMLDLYRVAQGKVCLRLGPADLEEVAREAADLVGGLVRERDHRLAVVVSPQARVVHADAARLRQVLVNLLQNAAKFTPPGGRLELTAGREGDAVVIRVRDNGVGIAPDLLPRVFDRFAQADPSKGGLGVGLALVRLLVELHGGSTWAESEGPGRGSTFVVRLPEPPTVPSPSHGTSIAESTTVGVNCPERGDDRGTNSERKETTCASAK